MSGTRDRPVANRLASVAVTALVVTATGFGSPAHAQSELEAPSAAESETRSPARWPAPSSEPFSAESEDAIAAALARYAREPSIEAVVRAALRVTPRGQAEELASRARMAGWVPRVGVRARRGQGVDLAASQTEQLEAVRLSTDDDLTLEASLTFDLDRVLFRSEEVALAREQRAESLATTARLREVVALYYERRRLQLERDLGATPSPARSARIAEIETLLDVFTGGEFRRMMRQPRWKTGVRTSATRSPSPRR